MFDNTHTTDLLKIELLGTPQIFLNEDQVNLRAYKALALFYYLAVAQKSFSRERLAELLWPGKTDKASRESLRTDLSKLRASLNDFLLIDRRSLAFDKSSNYQLDVLTFQEKIHQPHTSWIRLQEAADLYRGNFLENFYIKDAPDFNEWVENWRTHLLKQLQDVLLYLAAHYIDDRQYDQSLTCIDKLLKLDPLNDEAHHYKIQLSLYKGNRTEALAHYELYRQILQEELPGVEPLDEIRDLYKRMVVGEIKKFSHRKSPLQILEVITTPGTPFQVPATRRHFVGRDEEIKVLCQILTTSRESHIFGLVGMGGIGKTTLVNYIAHKLRDHFPDGVLWADVTLSDPLSILHSWAAAYGFSFNHLADLTSCAAALRGLLSNKKTLIVLDNVSSVQAVYTLLPGVEECPTLITTRDQELVDALNAPFLFLSELSPQSSYQLLSNILGKDRVDKEADVAFKICALLQNLPLAIEILAQKLKSRQRSLTKVLEQLEDVQGRLQQLKVSDREVQTSFEMSWAALTIRLKKVFSMLGVFEGRAFSVGAIAYISELDVDTADEALASLTALSLVYEEDRRYQQHPLLASFALEKLQNDTEVYREKMAVYYKDFAADYRHNYDKLLKEWDNLKAGMRVAFRQKQWWLLLQYAELLRDAWFACGRFDDAYQGFQWVLKASEALSNTEKSAWSLANLGNACIELNRYDEAQKYLQQGVTLYETLTDQAGKARVQCDLARIYLEQDRVDDALALLMSSREIWLQLDDSAGVATTYYREARIVYRHGRFEKANTLGQKALSLYQKGRDAQGQMRVLRLLAGLALAAQQHEEAEQYCQEALRLSEKFRDQGELAMTLYTLSDVSRRNGQYETAQDYAERSVDLLRHMGDKRSEALGLYQLSLTLEDQGLIKRALEVGSQSYQLYERIQDKYTLAIISLHMGDLYKRVQSLEQATEMWQNAMTMAINLDHKLLIDSLQKRLQTLG